MSLNGIEGDLSSDFLYKRLALEPGKEMDRNAMCLVHITEDCRPEPTATGKMGIYLGDFSFDDLTVDENERVIGFDIKRDLHKKTNDGTPVIQVGENDFILGAQCWWTPVVKGEKFDLEAAQSQVEVIREAYRAIMSLTTLEIDSGANDNTQE